MALPLFIISHLDIQFLTKMPFFFFFFQNYSMVAMVICAL